MKIYSNKGMYLETLINRTIDFYRNKHLAYFEKRNIPLKIVKNLQNDLVICKLLAKSTVDYCGTYRKLHFEFEAKQTCNPYFDLDQLKKHQYQFLIDMDKYQKAICFVLIYFEESDQLVIIHISQLLKVIENSKTQHLNKDDIINHGIKMKIVFPGILNLIECLDQLLFNLGKDFS